MAAWFIIPMQCESSYEWGSQLFGINSFKIAVAGNMLTVWQTGKAISNAAMLVAPFHAPLPVPQ